MESCIPYTMIALACMMERQVRIVHECSATELGLSGVKQPSATSRPAASTRLLHRQLVLRCLEPLRRHQVRGTAHLRLANCDPSIEAPCKAEWHVHTKQSALCTAICMLR